MSHAAKLFAFFIAIVVAVALWLAWVFQRPILSWMAWDISLEKAGAWGDSFGALNALFATLGFIAIFATLLLQQKQLRGSQEDQHRQRFESSYFELLRLLRETRNDVRFRHSIEYLRLHTADSDLKTGVDAFRLAWREALVFVRQSPPPSTIEVGKIYEDKIHKRYESNFGPYFRLVYTILQRIKDDEVLSEFERARYGNLLRSQLTSYELALLGLNGLSPISKDFRALVSEFHLLKYLPNGKRREVLRSHYPAEAFAPRD